MVQLVCNRCFITVSGEAEELVAPAYLTDDPWYATWMLCPDCAEIDNPTHIPDSWLLEWA